METGNKKKAVPKILIVDDLSINVQILENIIRSEGYEPYGALSVQEALDIMKDTMPELILSDFSMPGMNGLEFCKLLKSNPRTREIPFIFITVADSREEKRAAFQAGAVDFIPKPFEPIEVVMRMNNQLQSYQIRQEMEDYNRMMHKMVGEQKKQMEKQRESVLLALVKVMEKRNRDIGGHLERVGYNSRVLAQSLQLVPKFENLISDEFIDAIAIASKLHDIGHIIISGSEEEQRDKTHGYYAEEGAEILEDINTGEDESRFLNMAIRITRFHHAHWDGSGYPEGVSGRQIPLEARITAVVNDFDKLLYGHDGEEACDLTEAVKMIDHKKGVLYDPDIVDVFSKVYGQFRKD